MEGQSDKKVSKDGEKKIAGGERRKSSDTSKPGRHRSQCGEGSGGERRKSSEGGKKVNKSKTEQEEEDGPPALLPVSAATKLKAKHKVEHEPPVDMTMMDLFKPDGLIVHDQHKKEEPGHLDKPAGQDMDSQQHLSEHDASTYVKADHVQHVHHVLLEHQYSKPSSPLGVREEGEARGDTGPAGLSSTSDDIESVSHKHTLVDVTLPDQILEESEEPVVEEVTSDLEHTWPDNMDQLEQMVNREQPSQRSDRSSILESLGSELKESGSEFRIVGQVEVGWSASVHSEEAVESVTVSSSQSSKPHTSKVDKARDGRKHSLDTGQANTDKTRKDEAHQQEASRKVGHGDKRKHKKKRTDEEDGNEKEELKEEVEDSDEHGFEDDENDFDWEPNDSDTVYCICRKPHSNRFMICCDKCEEWFHGSCVGVSRAKGKQMEANEEEYICPLCTEKGESTHPETSPVLTTVKKSDSLTSTPKGQQKCIGRKCNKRARSGSVYCSNECIMSHAQDSLKAIREEQMKKKAREKEERHSEGSSSSSSSSARSHSSSSTKHSDTVQVVDRKSGTVLKGSSAPRQKELHRWLEKHPTFEVVQPSRHRSSSSRDKHREKSSNSDRDRKSSTDKDRKSSTDRDRKLLSDKDRKLSLDRERKSSSSKDRKSEKEEKGGHESSKDGSKKKDGERRASSGSQKSSTSKGEESREDGPNQIRLNVRTALRDSLTSRAHEADDIMLSSQEIKSLAVTIEEELFSLFQDTGHKYRTKYRSLLFNIKDHKNKGLFRKILTGKIRPHKLVQMSTEELASRELAKWREQESKQQLEMIEKTEKEAVEESASAKHVRKKTHKGEVEIEEEDLSILGTRIEEKKDVKPAEEEEQTTSPEIDTTDQHRAHLFDLNCKVCTGKIIPGPEEQAANAAASKLKVVKTESGEDHKDEEEGEEVEKEDFAKAEEIVKEALRTIQKTEQEVSLMPKMVPSSPKQEVISPVDSPKITTPGRESSSSASSTSSLPSRRNVVVRSPDSALQSGLEAKPKFTPTGPMLWKGFVSMLDVAKFFTSAYRVSGTTDHITIPDTIHILGRISPDHMWDYLSKIRQAGSKDLTVIRFIPGSDDEKVAYVHLYSYLNSRGRCGVAGNPNKQIKDFYIVPLASHSKIPRTLLPFDGPGLEENRPHMLIGILVRQRAKHGSDSSDTDSLTGKKSGSQSSSSSSSKRSLTMVNRDPRLAKLAAKENASKESSESPGQVSSPSDNNKSKSSSVEEYEPEYVPLPGKVHGGSQPVAEYIPTPTVKKKDKDEEKSGKKSEKDSQSVHSDTDAGDKRHHHHHHHHHKDHHLRHHQHQQHHHRQHENHHHHHEKKEEKNKELEDDSEPYSPSKEAEPYSPGQEAAADEPYDPGDESLMDDDGIPVVSSSTTSVCPTVTGGLSAEETKGREELVEKMARSNDPQEISSLMVTALSTTNSTQEQQKLLVDLTRQVEERKLQLAETGRKLGERSTQGHGEGKVSGRSEQKTGSADLTSGSTHGLMSCQLLSPGQVSPSDSSSQLLDSALSVRVSTCLSTVTCSSDLTKSQTSLLTSTASTVRNLPVSSTASTVRNVPGSSTVRNVPVSSTSLLSTATTTTSSPIPAAAAAATTSSNSQTGIKFSFNKSLSKTPLSSQTAQLFSAESVDSSDTKLKLSTLDEEKLSSQLSSRDSSKSLNVSQVGESQTVSSSQAADMPDALKALMKDMMGDGSSEVHGQVVDTDQEKCLLPGQEGTNKEKQLKTEEAELLTESEESRSSKTQESERVMDTAEMGKMERETGNEGTKEGGVTAPSIDELLDRLKKGGFQFPIKQPTESVVTTALSSTSSTTSTTPVSTSPQLTNDDQVAEVTTSSAMDVDLRVSSLTTAPVQPGPAGEVAVVSGEMDHPLTAVVGLDRRQTANVEDKDERRFYEDRDDRLFTPPFSLPKHPLDPRAFPPLPGETRPYPPSSQPATHPGSLHGPLHPRFPLPMAEPHLPYHPTSRPALTSRHPASKGRAQPPPPGTEYEKPAGVLGITNDFPHMDVDQRSRAHPPLPPQPPPPLPPLPGSSAVGGRFPHLPAVDMDLRAGDPYRSIPPPAPAEYRGHHGYSGHGRGGGRPYPRH